MERGYEEMQQCYGEGDGIMGGYREDSSAMGKGVGLRGL